MIKISIINGPNLNMLGLREVNHYGKYTLEDINKEISGVAKDLSLDVDFFQSNSEGDIVTYIQNCRNVFDGIIINPGAYTHTSVAIRDALLAVSIPFVEVHLSNVHAREEFRKQSYFSDKALGVITGFGKAGYLFALKGISEHIAATKTALS